MDYLALGIFLSLFTFRYARTIVSIFTFNLYRAKPVREKPRYTSRDVTVIVPTTFKSETELVHCLGCILACTPAAVLIVTAIANVEIVQTICKLKGFHKVRVLGVEKLNKRTQMIKALKEVNTDITVFADDDVFWPSSQYLSYLLAIFEDPSTGAGGTRQRTRRNQRPNIWNFLGICYLERRVWNNITTNAIDGSISTLSGRTAAYRTAILKNDDFFYYFTNDHWRGKPLNTDDDKCLTRFVYSHGWSITIQSDSRSVLETTLEDSPKYLSQCLRWARGHWRGNFIVMENESYWRSPKYWWGLYVIYVAQFFQFSLVVDLSLFGILVLAMSGSANYAGVAYFCFGAWIIFTKMLKIIPHFVRYPQDLVFLPVMIAFSYLHGFLNLYAALTLTKTHWGSQKLEHLEHARAKNEQVVPLLRSAVREGDHCVEPTPGRLMDGEDYFSAVPVAQLVDVTA